MGGRFSGVYAPASLKLSRLPIFTTPFGRFSGVYAPASLKLGEYTPGVTRLYEFFRGLCPGLIEAASR